MILLLSSIDFDQAKQTAQTAKSKPATVTGQNTNDLLNDHHWKRTFIPTLTHALYVSHEPFVDWSVESPAFLATVQKVFNLSFPNIQMSLCP